MGEGLTIPKIPVNRWMKKLLKGRGDSAIKEGDAVSLGIFVAGVWKM